MTESGKSPLKFYAHYYSVLSGDCQASIITGLWAAVCCFFCVYLMAHDSRKVSAHVSFFSARGILIHAAVSYGGYRPPVVSGWIEQIRRTVRPFNWVVSTQAKFHPPSCAVKSPVLSFVPCCCGERSPGARSGNFTMASCAGVTTSHFRLVPKHGLRLLGPGSMPWGHHITDLIRPPTSCRVSHNFQAACGAGQFGLAIEKMRKQRKYRSVWKNWLALTRTPDLIREKNQDRRMRGRCKLVMTKTGFFSISQKTMTSFFIKNGC